MPTREAGSSIAVRGIHKRFGRTHALKGVEFEAGPGSFTTLLGPSGSGKTTTLNIIAGIVQSDSGTVLVDGVDVSRTPVEKRNLGFVFQSYTLFPHMTVARNIGFPLAMRRVEKGEIQRRVAEVLDLVQLSHCSSRYPSQLSGGQQQRIALARAVVFQPRVLLLDEPLGALDASLRAHLQREIVRIGRELGVTIVYVTHDQHEALSMSDQIVLFRDGEVEQVATPREIYDRPASAFAARFVGAGSLIEGTVKRANGTASVVTAEGSEIEVIESDLRTGDVAYVVLRPDSVGLLDPGDGTWTQRVIGVGTVADVVFGGSHVTVRVSLDRGTAIESRVSAHDAGWRLGDRVKVYLAPGHLPAVVGPDPPSPAAIAQPTPVVQSV